MKYYDSHVHTTISHDGISTAADYELGAPWKNVKGITYTEHFDIYDGVDTDIKPLDIQHYINNYNSIKHKVDARLGLEVGLRPECIKKTYYQLGNYIDIFDFLIGSSHIVCGKDVAYDNSFFSGDSTHPTKTYQEAIEAYFE